MLRQGLLLILFSVFSQSFIFGQTNQLPVYEDEIAYEVYSAVLTPKEAERSRPLFGISGFGGGGAGSSSNTGKTSTACASIERVRTNEPNTT